METRNWAQVTVDHQLTRDGPMRHLEKELVVAHPHLEGQVLMMHAVAKMNVGRTRSGRIEIDGATGSTASAGSLLEYLGVMKPVLLIEKRVENGRATLVKRILLTVTPNGQIESVKGGNGIEMNVMTADTTKTSTETRIVVGSQSISTAAARLGHHQRIPKGRQRDHLRHLHLVQVSSPRKPSDPYLMPRQNHHGEIVIEKRLTRITDR